MHVYSNFAFQLPPSLNSCTFIPASSQDADTKVSQPRSNLLNSAVHQATTFPVLYSPYKKLLRPTLQN